METSILLVLIATLLGPILAVQAQKAVERATERRRRKEQLFNALMATRGTRLAQEHVQSLNSIPIVFGRPRAFWMGLSKSEKRVLDLWEEYFDVLNRRLDANNAAAMEGWVRERDSSFGELLFHMSNMLGYKFKRLQITKAIYNPVAHGQVEENRMAILDGVASIFKDGKPIPVAMYNSPEFIEQQKKIQDATLKTLDPDRIQKVRIIVD